MRQGYLREGDTTLWVDAHQLLYWTSEHLSRVKKIVNITMRLGLARTRFDLNFGEKLANLTTLRWSLRTYSTSILGDII